MKNYSYLVGLDWKSYIQTYMVTEAITDQTQLLDGSLDEIGTAASRMAANFNYGNALLLEELRLQRGTLKTIATRLDDLYEVLLTPKRTKARELFYEGSILVSKGIIDKGLEYLLKADKEYDVDFFTHFLIGKLYLYPNDSKTNIINLTEAEKHLGLAVRYGKAEIPQMSAMAALVAETILHLSITYFAQAVELKNLGKQNESILKLKQAQNLTKDAITVYSKFPEVHYHLAKYSIVLDDNNQAISSLESAILLDKNYCIKVKDDPDFDKIRNNIDMLIVKLAEQAKTKTDAMKSQIANDIKNAQNEYNILQQLYVKYTASKTKLKQSLDNLGRVFRLENGYDKIFRKINLFEDTYESFEYFIKHAQEILKEIEKSFKGQSYFDYLSLDDYIKMNYINDLKVEYNQLLIKAKDVKNSISDAEITSLDYNINATIREIDDRNRKKAQDIEKERKTKKTMVRIGYIGGAWVGAYWGFVLSRSLHKDSGSTVSLMIIFTIVFSLIGRLIVRLIERFKS